MACYAYRVLTQWFSSVCSGAGRETPWSKESNQVVIASSMIPMEVNDRISPKTDYANSPCLFELADYNKLQLIKCRRADDKLYNLIKFDNIPNVNPSHLQKLMNIIMILTYVLLIKRE